MIAVKVADETFIAVALLQREQPNRQDFTISEIVDRALQEGMTGALRKGLRVHATSHCVANRPPQPDRYRMLYATGKSTRRLLLSTDDVHPGRTGKIFPDPEDVPPRYRELIEWAKQHYSAKGVLRKRPLDNIFQLFGLGKNLWSGEDPDDYVQKLREGWN